MPQEHQNLESQIRIQWLKYPYGWPIALVQKQPQKPTPSAVTKDSDQQ